MENVYLQLKESVRVKDKIVHISDIATICCDDVTKKKVIDELIVFRFTEENLGKQVIGVLFLIQLIQKRYRDLRVQVIGGCDVIVEFEGVQNNSAKSMRFFHFLKMLFVALICFFGGAFTIMSFHTDSGISQMLIWIYEFVTGQKSDGFTIVEIGYAIGLSVGIILFFNHFGKNRVTRDYTPIEVAMRMYEQDVNTSMAASYEREGRKIDAS